MNDCVLVLLTTEDFAPQARSFWQNAIRQGKWDGDFALIALGMSNTTQYWFRDRGFYIYSKPRPANKVLITLDKLELFNDFFKQWKKVIFYDLDVIIKKDIRGLKEVKEFGAVRGVGPDFLKNRWVNHDNLLYQELLTIPGFIDAPGPNGGLYVIDTAYSEGFYERSQELKYKYERILCWEEGIMGLLNMNHTTWLPESYCKPICCSRIPTKDNVHAFHYLSWGPKPWKKGVYFNNLWEENLQYANNSTGV